MISVICVYNNEKVLKDYLLKHLKTQNKNYELILLDNTSGKFFSAAKALNYGANLAKSEYLMFIHQDFDLLYDSWLEDAEMILKNLDNLGIAGIAGRSKGKGWTITNIKDGIPPKFISPERIKKPIKVQTLDECLFIIPKTVFKLLKFDEDVCDGWHLYAVDYCLSIKNLGYDIYVIPLSGHHKSQADSLSEGYYSTLKKLLDKHGKSYELIHTTMGNWSVKYPLRLQKYFYSIKNNAWILLKR
ncbi:glycosyltransferase [Methanobacterium sp.]|uniref:glycosyltransferase n=1 Tax=Methanobacterium sp. TaxID=2164 RepID=UPI002ABB2129|nr:glycosyltransferase [Methanobacterium sp.]MDY9922732.1 glycosyltransferase [Methanobacterium sp.]